MQLLKHYFYIQKSIFTTHWYKRKVQESYSVLRTLQNMITHKYLLANSSGVKHTVIYDSSQWLFHGACKAWTMFRPGPGGRAQPSWPWWPCSRQYSCFRWVTMLSLISGIEICRRTLPLSKDRVLSPENISVIIRATTGMTCRTEDRYESSNQTPTHTDCRKWSVWSITNACELLPTFGTFLTWTMISFLSLGLPSGHSSPKHRLISNWGRPGVWPRWWAITPAQHTNTPIRTPLEIRWFPQSWKQHLR